MGCGQCWGALHGVWPVLGDHCMGCGASVGGALHGVFREHCMRCGASVGGALHGVWGQCWGSTAWGVGPVLGEHCVGCGASVGGALHEVWGQCCRGRPRISGGRGGLITMITSGGGYGKGCAPSRDSQGVWGRIFYFCAYLA